MNSIYQVSYLQRLPLGTNSVAVVNYVQHILSQLPGAELAIDLTGVGRPVFDLFHYSGISPVGVMIIGGTAETRDGTICHVPKLVLVSRLQALLHAGRLCILRPLPEAEILTRELQDFRVNFTAVGNMTFNARQGRHDDLVLALAIAVWRAEGGGLPGYGVFQYYREEALGQATSMFVGVDLGQSRDPTAVCVVRKVDNPAPRDLGVPLSPPIYARNSPEEARTSAQVPPSAEWRQRFDGALSRDTPDHPNVKAHIFEPINGPGAKVTYAIGSLELGQQQRDKANG